MIPAVYAFDVEPDPRMVYGNDPADWRGFGDSLELAEELRRALAPLQPEAPTFAWMLRLDPQMERAYGRADWLARTYRDTFARLRERGDEIGVHTHFFRWDEPLADWVTVTDDPAWRRSCLEMALGAYRDTFGEPAAVHSCGDRWFSADVAEVLEEQGARIDLTVEPGLEARATYVESEFERGGTPDFTRALRRVWRPSRGDVLEEDRERGFALLAIPVSTSRFPRYLDLGRRIYRVKAALRGEKGTRDDREQRFARACPAHRSYVFRIAIRRLRREFSPRHFHFVLRAAQASDARLRRRLIANCVWLARQGAAAPVVFQSPSRALTTLGLVGATRVGAASAAVA